MFDLFFFLVITISAIIHEYYHAWAAEMNGDSTAKDLGRLTLNPLAHIDLFGTIIMPLLFLFASGGRMLFAYAKPVPINPANFKNHKFGIISTALAGPFSNLCLAVVVGLIIRLLPVSEMTSFLAIVVYANLLLAIFNLVPIPPLDGSHLLLSFLSKKQEGIKYFLMTQGPVLLFIFILFGFQLIQPIIRSLFEFIVGFPLS